MFQLAKLLSSRSTNTFGSSIGRSNGQLSRSLSTVNGGAENKTVMETLTIDSFLSNYKINSTKPFHTRKSFILKHLSILSNGNSKSLVYSNFQKSLSPRSGSLSLAFNLRKDIYYILQDLRMYNDNKDSNTNQNSNINKLLRETDKFLNMYLNSSITRDSLIFKRIEFDSAPGSILQLLANKEHSIENGSLQEITDQLSRGKRCYAYFHHLLPNKPLIYCFVGLSKTSIASLKTVDLLKREDKPVYATIYSLQMPHVFLKGTDLGAWLVNEVFETLKQEFPSIEMTNVLAPIRQFNQWLQRESVNSDKSTLKLPNAIFEQLTDALRVLYPDRNEPFVNEPKSYLPILIKTLKSSDRWSRNTDFCTKLKQPLSYLAAHYLTNVKIVGLSKHNIYHPQDNEAQFHFRNGASLHSIKWMADTSPEALKNSAMMMAVYQYDREKMEANASTYAKTPSVAVCTFIEDILGEAEVVQAAEETTSTENLEDIEK